jgi:hypothetical protein
MLWVVRESMQPSFLPLPFSDDFEISVAPLLLSGTSEPFLGCDSGGRASDALGFANETAIEPEPSWGKKLRLFEDSSLGSNTPDRDGMGRRVGDWEPPPLEEVGFCPCGQLVSRSGFRSIYYLIQGNRPPELRRTSSCLVRIY